MEHQLPHRRPAAAAILAALAAWFLAGCGSHSAAGPVDADVREASAGVAAGAPADPPGPAYEQRAPTARGTGKLYLGREIAIPVGHAAADWLERPQRLAEEQPHLLIEALPLLPDDVVADVGAGTGYYTFRLAERVPRGKVLAVDIEPGLLGELREAAARRGVTNVEPILGAVDDPRLPAGVVDLVLIVDAYHEFSHPREMMAAIVRALAPGGKVALVEYRAEDPDLPVHRLHKMTEAQARREMEAAGLVHLETRPHLPRQHLMVFERLKAEASRPWPAWCRRVACGSTRSAAASRVYASFRSRFAGGRGASCRTPR
jgi:SAM-dependent methyltransferase